MVLVRLGRHNWQMRRASFPSTRHHLLSAPNRRFEESTHILAAACRCMRVSLLQLLLRLATEGIRCALLGRVFVCFRGVCDSHQAALHRQALLHHIMGCFIYGLFILS